MGPSPPNGDNTIVHLIMSVCVCLNASAQTLNPPVPVWDDRNLRCKEKKMWKQIPHIHWTIPWIFKTIPLSSLSSNVCTGLHRWSSLTAMIVGWHFAILCQLSFMVDDIASDLNIVKIYNVACFARFGIKSHKSSCKALIRAKHFLPL